MRITSIPDVIVKSPRAVNKVVSTQGAYTRSNPLISTDNRTSSIKHW